MRQLIALAGAAGVLFGIVPELERRTLARIAANEIDRINKLTAIVDAARSNSTPPPPDCLKDAPKSVLTASQDVRDAWCRADAGQKSALRTLVEPDPIIGFVWTPAVAKYVSIPAGETAVDAIKRLGDVVGLVTWVAIGVGLYLVVHR